ncbi:hypothetical protein PROFUN_13328, partial [Planoprotostelium fungivorum]
MTCKCTRNAVLCVSGYNLPAYEREIFIEGKTATYEGRQMTMETTLSSRILYLFRNFTLYGAMLHPLYLITSGGNSDKQREEENSATKKHIQCTFIEKELLGFLWYEIILYKQRLIELFGSYVGRAVLQKFFALLNVGNIAKRCHDVTALTFQRPRPHTGSNATPTSVQIFLIPTLFQILEDLSSIPLGNNTSDPTSQPAVVTLLYHSTGSKDLIFFWLAILNGDQHSSHIELIHTTFFTTTSF